jgi:type IV pilus assembly protein PilQ
MSSLATTWASVVLALAGGGAGSLLGAPWDADGVVTGFDLVPSGTRTELVVSVSGAFQVRDFTMQGPDRIVLDLLGGRFAPGQASVEARVNRGGVLAIHATQYAPDVVRIVMDVDRAQEYTVLLGDGYVRVSMNDPWHDPALAFLPWSSAIGEPVPGTLAATGVGTGIAPNTPPGRVAGTLVGTTQPAPQSLQEVPRISLEFQDTPVREIIYTFSTFSGRSIVQGAGVTGNFSGSIRDQPWDIALYSILDAMGLAAREEASGIIRVVTLADQAGRDALEPMVTQTFRVSFANVSEMATAVGAMLTDRGTATPYPANNTLIVNDVSRVLTAVTQLIEGLDTRTPSVAISASIHLVNRTDLQEAGLIYDLKDSAGNQLNPLTPGGIDRNGDGVIAQDEIVPVGTNVISLGGSSIALLGNANQRVASPSLQFLGSVLLGRRTLITFLEALQSVNLSAVEARPQVTVMDNQLANLSVGERTPLRVIDAGADQAAGGEASGGLSAATATTELVETGIILRVTPHVVAGGLIWMEIHAERSGVVPDPELGPSFPSQLVDTRVIVADGATAVMGGLTVTEENEVRSGIPLLQELPIIGRLFRTTRLQTIQRDLVILVTPRIVPN